MFNYYVKFLTCDESLHLKNGDFKSYKYENKKRVDETVYDSSKRSYCERRSGYWRAPHPRQLRQLESKLRDRSIITCEWTNESLITLVFSSGAIAYLTVKPNTLDVTQILFDRYCVGKLAGQTITGVVICQSHLMYTHADRLATLISFGKSGNHSTPSRISDRDPHIQSIELGGGTRRSERKVSWCESKAGVQVLVWSTSMAEPAPWSPVIEDHANLHLYHINGQQMSLIAYHQLENETLSAELSHTSESIVHIIEQITCHKNGVSLEWLRYEVPAADNRVSKLSCLRESATRASLPAPARVAARSPCCTKILTACIDGSLHVIHHTVGVTHSVRAGFIATEVRWAGDLILAAEEGGRVQCFDRALSLLHHHTKCFDLTSYLRDAKRMQILASQRTKGGPLILVYFNGGPLALLHITHPRLLTTWLRMGRSANAVALLRAMDWERDGTECLWAVNKLVCAALRNGTEALSEEGSAQAALGAYLSPGAAPGPAAAALAPPVHDLARKFFHHLLRRGRIEKALSLAVDLRAWDLFVDARWAASSRGLPRLAHEAATLAAHTAALHPDSECSDSCSQCSSSQSSSDAETSVSSEIVKTKPPPLPRVSIPTLMPVPITQAEQISTNSIRPNLHQYLERDNTIWTTNVDDTYVKISSQDKIKPILTQNMKWHSTENMALNSRQDTSMPTLASISESPTKASSIVDIASRSQDERLNAHFRNVYQTEIREEVTNTIYRYSNNNYNPNSLSERYGNERVTARPLEKNKVTFSDTVKIAVVSEPSIAPESSELAGSLPLCAPHKYLAAFEPARRPPPDSAARQPPKIKVVHFGMV